MSRLFKPKVTPKLIEMLSKSIVGQVVKNKTGRELTGILENCFIETPEKPHDPDFSGVMESRASFKIDPKHIQDIIMLLKQAWVVDAIDEFDSSIHKSIREGVNNYETRELGIINHRELGVASEELSHFMDKQRATSKRNSKSASKKRPWELLDKWISDEIEDSPGITELELWKLLPNIEDGEHVYREEDKVYSKTGKEKSIKFQAFRNHVRAVKNKEREEF